jgi:DNA-directed RNA polymerase specialized sigma24 family protein
MNRTPNDDLASALEAVINLWMGDFARLKYSSGMAGTIAHSEIERLPFTERTGPFYRNLIPLRTAVVRLLTDSYRQYFKIALAHHVETGSNLDEWAWDQLQPALHTSLEWLVDSYMLVCDGSNQWVRPLATIPFRPGEEVSFSIPTVVPPCPPLKSWRAPAWLFGVSPEVGINLLKSKHVPLRDSEERLGAGHTRLLLKGARRMFLLNLGQAIEKVRNEELAASGAIVSTVAVPTAESAKRRSLKRKFKGTEGLGKKTSDLSKYMDGLTEKQQLALSLRLEYRLPLAEVASRMGINRKTAYEHFMAARRKIDQIRSNNKRAENRKEE